MKSHIGCKDGHWSYLSPTQVLFLIAITLGQLPKPSEPLLPYHIDEHQARATVKATLQGLIHQSGFPLLVTYETLVLECQLPCLVFLQISIIWHHGVLLCVFSITLKGHRLCLRAVSALGTTCGSHL